MFGLKNILPRLIAFFIYCVLLSIMVEPAASAGFPQHGLQEIEKQPILSPGNQPITITPIYLSIIRKSGPTGVCGAITANAVWTIYGSPYHITCDVIVPTGVTLTIDAGVMVLFHHTEDDVIVYGMMQTLGTPYGPVKFQPLSGGVPGSWGRVAFMPGSSGVLDHAILEYGGSYQGEVYIASDGVRIVKSMVQFSADSGIYIHEASPVISATQIMTNTGTNGCGLYNDIGSPIIKNNTFSGNYCRFDIDPTYGGGLYNGSGNPVIQNNNFIKNQGSHGNGLYNGSGNPDIKDNLFTLNGPNPDYGSWSYCYGGGLDNDSGSPIIQNNTFANNWADGNVFKNAGYGGGLANHSGSPSIRDNTFVGNYAAGAGGGLISSGNPTIENNLFDGNSASGFVGHGGGIAISGNPIIQGNTFIDNGVRGGKAYGGGLACIGDTPLIQNNVFDHNHADGGDSSGGGIYCLEGSPIIRNNTFSNNTVGTEFSNGSGGGIAVSLASNAIIHSNIVVSNTATSGGGIYIGYHGDPSLDYNDVWNNTGGNYYDINPGLHDISLDPLLVDHANGDFHLAPGSPCIDAGDPLNYPPTDFEGDLRPSGPAPDIGADEYVLRSAFSVPALPIIFGKIWRFWITGTVQLFQ
jgi:parallel beta-helix repeat protein